MKYLIFILILISCSPDKDKKPIEKVNEINENIVFIFKKQNPNTNFKNNVNIEGGAIYFTEENNFFNIELNPKNTTTDDTIVININSSKVCLSHSFNSFQKYLFLIQKGDTAIINYDKGYPHLNILNRKTLTFDNNFYALINLDKPLEEFEFFIKNKRMRNEIEKKLHLDELKSYTYKIDTKLDSLKRKNLISDSNWQLYKDYNKFYFFNLNKSSLNTINKEDLKRDNLLFIKTYRHFLNNYVVNRYELKTKFKNDPLSCDGRKAFDLIQKDSVFSKRVKESLLFTQIINIAENYSNDDLINYFNKFKKEAEDQNLIKKISETYLLDFSVFKSETEKVYFTDANKKNITLDNLIKNNAGKVIYVDFWASWCAPCRIAMPSSKKLKNKFSGEDIVFVYISIDTDFDKWLNASQIEQLNNIDYNYLALNYPNANFYKDLNLKSIPRYLIYDKKGKLVHQNAPSPDSPEIETELQKYISE
jgi:thiol-disulfide isomerase/thioredoxin